MGFVVCIRNQIHTHLGARIYKWKYVAILIHRFYFRTLHLSVSHPFTYSSNHLLFHIFVCLSIYRCIYPYIDIIYLSIYSSNFPNFPSIILSSHMFILLYILLIFIFNHSSGHQYMHPPICPSIFINPFINLPSS